MHSSRKNVGLLVETSFGSGRQILRGIARFAHEQNGWLVEHTAGALGNVAPDWLDGWQGDGIIARVQSEEQAANLAELGVPIVDVLGLVSSAGFPIVHVDDHQIALEAAQHFQEREFRHFAYFANSEENWSTRRGKAFVGACDGEVHEYCSTRDNNQRDQLLKWLRELPKPIGVFVSCDRSGFVLLEACREAGYAVPEQIAVVGVDNDVPLCEISSPQLTSIRAGHSRVGYEAASLLDRLMNGGAPPSKPLLVPPTSIVSRGSTDIRAITDPAVAQALRYIRENIAAPLTNTKVAAVVGVSRTQFQKRFRAEMNTSIHDYLTSVRINRARHLITTSNLTLADIAERSGFRHQEYLGDVFKKKLGVTPGSLRTNRQS